MKIIEHDGKIISIIYRDKDWEKGLNFITPENMFIQVGSWWYQKDKELQNTSIKILTELLIEHKRVYMFAKVVCKLLCTVKIGVFNLIYLRETWQFLHMGGMDTKFLKMTLKL